MSFDTGFYTDTCSVLYSCNFEEDTTEFEKPQINVFNSNKYDFKTSFYGFLYVFSGKMTVYHFGQIVEIPEKTLLVTSPDYPFYFVKSIKNTEIVLINLHSSIIRTFEKSDDLFKIFYADDLNKLIYPPKTHKDSIIDPLFNSLKSNVLQHYNEPFICSRVVTLITEINTVFDRVFGDSEKKVPNISARIIDYIERHYSDDITIDLLCEKFSISPSSIHRICKKSFGVTFKEQIAALRLREARALITKKNIMPSSAGKICGYNSYSSFFRAYKKAFGVSPMEDVANKQRWPLT